MLRSTLQRLREKPSESDLSQDMRSSLHAPQHRNMSNSMRTIRRSSVLTTRLATMNAPVRGNSAELRTLNTEDASQRSITLPCPRTGHPVEEREASCARTVRCCSGKKSVNALSAMISPLPLGIRARLRLISMNIFSKFEIRLTGFHRAARPGSSLHSQERRT